MTKGEAPPVWERTSAEKAMEAPSPELRHDVDLVVVGGGYTGLSLALHAAERGLSVQLFEAETAGAGGSGRNVGLVNAGLWLPPETVIARLGEPLGRSFLDSFGRAPQIVFDLIERHGIACDPVRSGTIHAAHSPRGMADLRRRFAAWQALGAPVELLDAARTAGLVGTAYFHGGLLDHRAGTVNPLAYARGLARAARRAGAAVAEHTPATGLVRDGRRWRVQTTRGEARAKAVALCTNAYCGDLWPGLRRSFIPIRYFQAATEPLGDRGRHILPGGQGVWDTGAIMFDLRRDRAGRLLIGSMGRSLGGPGSGVSRLWAQRQIAGLFPELGPVRIEDVWDGRIAMTGDHLPAILNPAPGLWIPTWYNGRGITTGTLFGAALAEVIAGAPVEALPRPPSGQFRKVPLGSLVALLLDIVFAARQLHGIAWPRRRRPGLAGAGAVTDKATSSPRQ